MTGDILQAIGTNPAATAFGTLGLLCQLLWPAMRTRRAIMVLQLGASGDYALHYALLEAWCGAAICTLGALQCAVAVAAGDKPWFRYAGAVFLPAVLGVSLATWSGPASVFALSAVTLITLGRLQRDTLRLRALLLTAAPFGIGHDIVVGAFPAMLGGVFAVLLSAAMLVREARARSQRFPLRTRALSAAAT